jgi:hypothetical protein
MVLVSISWVLNTVMSLPSYTFTIESTPLQLYHFSTKIKKAGACFRTEQTSASPLPYCLALKGNRRRA